MYNDIDITAGESQDESSNLKLFGYYNNNVSTNSKIQVALYALEIYDRDLTDEEIEQVKARMIAEYEAKTGNRYDETGALEADYEAYDKTNDDDSRAVLEDLTGNGHNINLYNFLFAEGSGYGKYGAKYFVQENISSTLSRWNCINSTTIKGKANTSVTSYGFWQVGIGNIFIFKLKVSGVLDDNKVYIHQYVTGYNKVELKNGINDVYIDTTNSEKPNYPYLSFSSERNYNTDITIELIPDYKGALVSDGVDDCGLCENFPIFNTTDGFTIIGIRKWLDNTGVGYLVGLNKEDNSDTSIIVDGSNNSGFYYKSFGYLNGYNEIYRFASKFIYANSESYCGNKVSKLTDSFTDSRFRLFNSTNKQSCALYALKIYNRDLTDEEIEKEKAKMIKRYEEKTGEKYTEV